MKIWNFFLHKNPTSNCHKETPKPYLGIWKLYTYFIFIRTKNKYTGLQRLFGKNEKNHVCGKSILKKFFKFFLTIGYGRCFESTVKTAFQGLKRRFKATFDNYLSFLAIFLIVTYIHLSRTRHLSNQLFI